MEYSSHRRYGSTAGRANTKAAVGIRSLLASAALSKGDRCFQRCQNRCDDVRMDLGFDATRLLAVAFVSMFAWMLVGSVLYATRGGDESWVRRHMVLLVFLTAVAVYVFM